MDDDLGDDDMDDDMDDAGRNALEMLRDVVSATAACTGQDFFNALVRRLARALAACCAFVTEFEPGSTGSTTARVRSFWIGNEFRETFDYDLEGTPCERVLGGKIVAISRDVQQLFPRDRNALASLGAVSFLAIPLLRQDAQIRGHLAVIDRRERDWRSADFGILEIVATRATAELDRQQDERKLKAANRELQRLKEAAEKSNMAKSEFVASMSHELRTPLNAILGYAQLLKRDATLGELQQGEVAAIERGGEHLLALINDILDMAKFEAGRLELDNLSFDLQDFLNTVADMARIQASRRGLSFTWETRSPLPARIRADERRLRQILLNLLGNAVKFTDSGAVTFRVGYTDGDGESGRLHFEIEDTGIGIPAADLTRIFERFTQGTLPDGKRSNGSGLGLSISRQLARAMGGDIRVVSEPHRGSLFSADVVVLRDLRHEHPYPLPVQQRITGHDGPRRRLLVVDDDADSRDVLKGLLVSLGFEVTIATNGREALEAASSVRPDLVFMDVVMPVMDGLAAIRELRAHPALGSMPVIAVSASVIGQTHADCLAAGFDGFLNKPVRFDEVIDVVRGLVELPRNAPPAPPPSPAARHHLPDGRLLAELYELARRGDIRALRQAFESAQSSGGLDPELLRRLRDLAGDFDMKGIRKLLDQVGGSAA